MSTELTVINDLTVTGLKYQPIEANAMHGGGQLLFRFDNGYGASVIRHNFSYGGREGLFELAVIKFYCEDWSLCYDTPITDDVLGRLTGQEVLQTLDQIAAL